jgi:hypothetical protein
MNEILGIVSRLDNSDIWALMEIAEEEIIRKLRACQPKNSEMIYGAFVSLRPIVPMPAMWMYQAHCRELLARLDSDDYSPDSFACMTWSEILSGFAEATPHVRLNDISTSIMYYTGRRVSEYLDKHEAPKLFDLLSDYERDFPASSNPLLEREIAELRAQKVERAMPKPEPIPERWRKILGI